MRRVAIGELVDVEAGSVHVRQDGPPDAPVLVLVHGFTCSLHWYDSLVPLLSADRRVIRVDLLGTGCTVAATSRFDADTQTSMLVDVLDRLGVETFAIAGHSFGADVAIGVAERLPGATHVLVLGQAADYSSATLPRGRRLLGLPGMPSVIHRAATLHATVQTGGVAFAPGFRPVRADAHRVLADLRATDPRTFVAVTVDREKSFADRPLDTRLAELALPAMVVLGGQDQMYPVAPTRARYDAVDGVRVEVLPDSGHSPMVEQPHETAALITDFLDSAPAHSLPGDAR